MFYAIVYLPFALSTYGFGAKTYYNTDGALSGDAVTATFNAAKTGGLIGSDVAYSGALVTVPNLIALYAGNGQVIDTFTRSSATLAAYQCGALIDGATVSNGLVETPGGGGGTATPYVTADQVITASTLTDITELSFPVLAGEVWFIAVHVAGTTNSTGQPRIGITGPASPLALSLTSDARTGTTGVQHKRLTAFDTEDDSFSWSTGNTGTWHAYGVFANGPNAGTFKLQARNIDGVSQITILAGSHIHATRIA
jgi:hypothetical protein